ncbi:MAG: replication factor C large subunit, partial [Candidatus Hodarchaeales archaeon]
MESAITSWVQKYAPAKKSDVKGNPAPLQTLWSWLDRYPKVKTKALLLAGPPGIGKTSGVFAYARENGYEVIEFNASDQRNKGVIENDFLKAVTTLSLLTLDMKKIVLVDEVDGISAQKDRGGVAALIKILEKAAFPVILTCNDLQNKRLSSLKKKKDLVKVLRFNRLRTDTMINLLADILDKEGIDYDRGILRIIVEESGGDMRGAINDLENLSYGRDRITSASLSVLKNRDRLLDKKEAIQRIFSSKSTNDALDCTRNMDLDFNYLIMWIYQNAYKWAGTPSELSEMYRYIALANIHRSRIYKRQYWKLLKYYFYFLSAGVNFAKKTPYQTQNIDWPYWGRRKKPPAEAIEDFQRIAKRNNMSMNKFYREMLPYIKLIFKYNIGKAYSLMQEYSLREETVKELAGEEFEKYKVYRKEFWKPLKEKTTIQEKRRVKVKKAVTRKKTARKKKKTGKKSIKPITAIEPLLPEKSQVIKRIQDQTIEKETIKAEQKGVSVSETGKEEQDGKKKKTKK